MKRGERKKTVTCAFCSRSFISGSSNSHSVKNVLCALGTHRNDLQSANSVRLIFSAPPFAFCPAGCLLKRVSFAGIFICGNWLASSVGTRKSSAWYSLASECSLGSYPSLTHCLFQGPPLTQYATIDSNLKQHCLVLSRQAIQTYNHSITPCGARTQSVSHVVQLSPTFE